jgi:hypothetical protein
MAVGVAAVGAAAYQAGSYNATKTKKRHVSALKRTRKIQAKKFKAKKSIKTRMRGMRRSKK